MNLKEKIIHESLKLFSLKGFLSTSINDILEAANTSKGGLYNHFKNKEDLFLHVIQEAQRVWRERNLDGLDQIERPMEKIQRFLENYRDRYMKDTAHFPGGCVFVTLSVELDDQRPILSREIKKGFEGLRKWIKGLLDQGKEFGEIRKEINTEAAAEMIFAGVLGASVAYGSERSSSSLDRTIQSLIDYLGMLAP